jgi:hypothetical protein
VVELGGYREVGWPEDYDLWLRAAAAGLRFAKVPEVLLGWRDHPTRQTRTHPRYAAAAHLRCKAHFLARGPLAGRSAVLWGGAVASKLAALLDGEGSSVVAFVDIDPRKIGGTRRGRPVLAPEAALALYKDAVVVAAVGRRGARELIRAEATRLGRIEGADFLCAA